MGHKKWDKIKTPLTHEKQEKKKLNFSNFIAALQIL